MYLKIYFAEMVSKIFRVEITINSGIFITDLENGISIVLSACNSMSAIDHPMGRVFAQMSRIEIQAPNEKGIRYIQHSYKPL